MEDCWRHALDVFSADCTSWLEKSAYRCRNGDYGGRTSAAAAAAVAADAAAPSSSIPAMLAPGRRCLFFDQHRTSVRLRMPQNVHRASWVMWGLLGLMPRPAPSTDTTSAPTSAAACPRPALPLMAAVRANTGRSTALGSAPHYISPFSFNSEVKTVLADVTTHPTLLASLLASLLALSNVTGQHL